MGEISKYRKKPAYRPPSQHSQKHTLKVVNQGYGDVGGSTTKRALKGFNAVSGSPALDIDANNLTIRQRARMLFMGSPIATSAIRTNRTNVIGMGLVPKPSVDAEALGMTREAATAWQKAAEREFRLWADDKRACDSTGVNNFYALQQLVFQSWLLSGDSIVLVDHHKISRDYPYGLRLHVIEADRVATPTDGVVTYQGYTTRRLKNDHLCYDGVEIDDNGAIVAYHVRNGYPQDTGGMWTAGAVNFTRISAYGAKTGLPNVLHVMDSERPEQYRGVSYLAQVIEPLAQIKRYSDAELVAAVVESFFTAFVMTEKDTTELPFNSVTTEADDAQDDETDWEEENEYEMGPGQIQVLKPGESVSYADPKRPTNGFADFVHAISEEIGAALEIPRDLLLKQFNASYSASRAALMEAWKAFRMRRAWFVDDFCKPVWELWLTEAVARGRLNAPGFFTDPAIRAAYLKCEWVGPSQGQLDPTKEINAEIAAIAQGLTTREAAAIRYNGSDWDANVERLEYEQQRLKDAGIEVTSAGARVATAGNAYPSAHLEESDNSDEPGNPDESGNPDAPETTQQNGGGQGA